MDLVSGLDLISIRLFRWDDNSKSLNPIWNSGVNEGHNFIWAKIMQPGIFVAIRLPLDPLLRHAIKNMAKERMYLGSVNADENENLTKKALSDFLNPDEKILEDKRLQMILEESHRGGIRIEKYGLKHGNQGRVIPYDLPLKESIKDFRKRINNLKIPIGGLPEECLFFSPEMIQ